MLLGNFNQFNKNPGRAVGGPSDPTIWFKAGTTMQYYMPSDCLNSGVIKSSFPDGYTPPYSRILAPVAGGMSTSLISSTGSMTNTLYGAKFAVAPLGGSGTITNADAGLIVNAIANLSASGVISNAGLNAAAQMTADLAASGDIVGALTALGHLVADISTTATLEAENYAIAHMTATIGDVSQTLTAAQVAQEVWNTVASTVNNSGTTGEKLNAAGTAGDPWTADLDGYNTPGTAGKKLKDQKNPSLLIAGQVII